MNPQLEGLLQRLPELDAALRAADFTVSPDRWQSVYDLIYRLDQEQRLPEDPQALAPLIAPLFCNNKAEQQTFHNLFRHWLGDDFDPVGDSGEVLHQSVLARKQQEAFERQTRRRPLWSFVVVFLLLAVWVVWYTSKPGQPVVSQPDDALQTLGTILRNERTITRPPGGSTSATPAGETVSIPPREPAEPVRLDEQSLGDMRFLRNLLLSLPLVFLLAWLFQNASRKRALRRFFDDLYASPLHYLKLRRSNKTLPFGWGEFSQRLKHTGAMETRKLDIERTIDKTIHRAGLFTPVMLRREREPAYLVLTNRANPLDHDADRANVLFDRLKEANVTVYRFEYHDDPRLCFSTGQSRKAHTLNQLARHYPGCRLILIGDGEALIDPFTGETHRWVRQFEAWHARVLLTPVPQPWDAREAQIAHAGFAVAPFQVNGLEAVSDWLLKPSLDAVWFQPGSEIPLPDLFALDESAWLTDTPPPGYDADTTARVLVDYLGQSGYRLLTACAAYPQLVSELTLTLDQVLFPADNGAAHEKRLLRLTRLPWFREGRLPPYLRRDLLDRAGDAQIERINEAYTGIFARVARNLFARGGSIFSELNSGRFGLSAVGLGLLAAAVWFIGPLLQVGTQDYAPLAYTTTRMSVIAALLGSWVLWLWWRRDKAGAAKEKGRSRREGLRAYILDLVRFAPPGSPLADPLLTEVVFSRPDGMLDRLLGLAGRRLPGDRFRFWPVLLSWTLAALVTGVLFLAWQQSQPAVEQVLMSRMLQSNGQAAVRISTHEDTQALGDALEAALVDFGFSAIERRHAPPLDLGARLDDNQREAVVSAQLSVKAVTGYVADVMQDLTLNIDGQAYRLDFIALDTPEAVRDAINEFGRLVNERTALDLQRRLVAALSAPATDLSSVTRIEDIMRSELQAWTTQISADLSVSSSRRSSLQPGGAMRVAEQKKTVPPAKSDSELEQLRKIIIERLPDMMMQALAAPARAIVKAYDQALQAALAKAGEARRAQPDAIVYRPGYERTARRVQQRLGYLAYGREYPILADDGNVLGGADNAGRFVDVVVNLSRPLTREDQVSASLSADESGDSSSATDVPAAAALTNFQARGPGLTVGKPSKNLLDATGYTLKACLQECERDVHGACVAATFHANNECKLFESYTGVVDSNVADKMVYLRKQAPAALIEPEMVVLPDGRFVMGSPVSEPGQPERDGKPTNNERPQHEVSIRSFALSKTEVTFDEYDAFAKITGRPLPGDEGWGRGLRPVINVSWDDAVAYAAWLSEQTGNRYRLPSEAEWEYAARAGSTTMFFFGEDETGLCNYANFWEQSAEPQRRNASPCDDGVGRQTAPVANYRPNLFQLFDTMGNVWEWTRDCWHDNYEVAPVDGSAWVERDCGRRVVRGGSWRHRAAFLRSAYRHTFARDVTNDSLGFRLARDLDKGACFWMKDAAPYPWVPAPQGNVTKEECFQLDSCNGGLGRSGGGCYKWAQDASAQREPW